MLVVFFSHFLSMSVSLYIAFVSFVAGNQNPSPFPIPFTVAAD
jgi:hypothetical protein